MAKVLEPLCHPAALPSASAKSQSSKAAVVASLQLFHCRIFISFGIIDPLARVSAALRQHLTVRSGGDAASRVRVMSNASNTQGPRLPPSLRASSSRFCCALLATRTTRTHLFQSGVIQVPHVVAVQPLRSSAPSRRHVIAAVWNLTSLL